MNFRITKFKSIVSIIIAFIFGFWGYSGSGCFDCPSEMIQNIKIYSFILMFVNSIVLVYSIWSLLEKDKKTSIGVYIIAIISIIVISLLIFFIINPLLSNYFLS